MLTGPNDTQGWLALLLLPNDDFFALPQHQRDLHWSIFGPSLLDCDWSPAQLPEFLTRPLANQQQAPEFNSPRLGLMFEQYWHQYLNQQQLPWQANTQIRHNGQTLGELDLLLHHQQDWHIELALKFYLGLGQEGIGPNRRDLLGNKMAHTRDRQLQLSQNPQAQAQLQAQGWQPRQSISIMRGCLFHPAHPDVSLCLAPEINPNHWRGHWCHQQDAAQLLPSGHWFVLSKPQWISPALCPFGVSNDDILRYSQRHFQDLTVALCLVQDLMPRTAVRLVSVVRHSTHRLLPAIMVVVTMQVAIPLTLPGDTVHACNCNTTT